MRRREFLTLLSGAAAWPLAARAQQAALPVVGFLYGGSPETATTLVPALRKGLGETGYVEGQNVAIEYRWANNEFNRFPELAADLVRHRLAVIATQGASRRLWRPKPPRQQFRLYSASGPIRFKRVWSPVSIDQAATSPASAR